MDKREMLQILIDKLLTIEESTPRGVSFSYDSSLGVNFYVITEKGNYKSCIRKTFRDFHFNEGSFPECLTEISEINNTPNPEPEIEIKILVSRARELGLFV